MDTLSPDIENINQFIDGNVGIVIAVLESGNSVELKATGYSMFPTLRPGDRVVVKPLTKGELPMLGTVVVFMGNGGTVQRRNGATEERRKGATEERCNSLPRFIGGITEEGHNNITAEHHNVILVMHRLTEIRVDDRVIPQLITRGDSLNESDKPWPRQQLLGVAVSYKRSGKEHLIKNFIPGAWRYKYNRRLLWMFGKIKRLSLGPGKLLKNK